MKYLKIYEDYFDKNNPFTFNDGDEILKAFDENDIHDGKKKVENLPTYRNSGETIETTFSFRTSTKSVKVKYIESPYDNQIFILLNGALTDIPKDGEYREEILKRCQEIIN